jgi:VanZ family protein
LWLATAASALLIFIAGSLPGGGPIPIPGGGWDKLGHAVGYAGLGALGCLALRAEGLASLLAVGLALLASVAYGALDEWRQAFVPGRFTSLADLLADGLGAALGVAAAGWLRLAWLREAEEPDGRYCS